jgi:rhodanese-related sulfurtransferase
VIMRFATPPVAGLLAVSAIFVCQAHAEQNAMLGAVEAKIRASYASIPHMTSAEYEALEASGEPIVLLDARSKEEFAVSHLPGAHYVDPGIWKWSFRNAYGSDLKGKKVVIYCAVGARSSNLASRITDIAKEAGATGIYNLEGGIFRWHNEGRPLVGPNGKTDEIHPYDENNSRLIDRKDLIAYTPGGSKRAKAN